VHPFLRHEKGNKSPTRGLMKKDDPGLRFSRELNLVGVQRMSGCANVSKLARAKLGRADKQANCEPNSCRRHEYQHHLRNG
jgi:hypothetical protein